MLCILCVKFPDQIIDIFGEDGIRLDADSVIVKHFWIQPNQSDENARFICCTCWNALDSFHKFYQQIEEAHINLVKTNTTEEDDLKQELDHTSAHQIEIEDVEKYNPCTDFIDADVKLEVKEDTEVLLPEYESIPYIEDKVSASLVTKSAQRRSPDSGDSDDSESEIPLANLAKNRIKIDANLSSNEESDSLPEWQDHHSDVEDDGGSDFKVKKSTTNITKKRGRPCKNSPRDFTPKQASEEQIKKRELSLEYDEIIQSNMKLSCNICQISLANFFSLKKHYRSKHNERGYASCCGKKFLKRGILVDHIYIHLNPEHFKCDKCDKVLADRRCLEVHMNTHITEKQRIYQCDQCCKSFFKKPLLTRHMHIHIPEEDRKFPCEECNKFFPSNYTLRAHINNVHQNAYAKICDQCGKSIRGREAFQRHLLEHAGVPIPSVQCDKCGAKLKNKYGLKRHMNSMHAESNVPHVCNICGKVAPNSAALQRHYSYVHKCERNHKCPMCDKAFKKPGGLKIVAILSKNATAMLCILCVKFTDQIIDIFGENGLLFNAGSVIAKHFWIQPNQNCENTRYICCTCWNAVDSFHKFYQQVEEAHISLSKIRTTEEVGFKEELDHTSDVKTDAENVEKYGQYSDYLCADVKLEIKEDAEVYLPHDPLAVSEEKDNTDSITKPRQICAPDSDNSNDTDSEMPLSKLAKRCSSQQRNLSNSKESSASPECHDHDPTEDDDSNWGANKSTPTPKRVQKTAKKRGRSGKKIPSNLTPKQSTKEQIRKRELSHEHDEIIFKNIKLTCNICQLSLANFFSLKKHYRSTHNERGYALCCGKKFLKRCYLVDHINTHLNPEYFKCVKCEKVLVDRRSFDLHVKTHTTAKHRTFECDQCLKTFNQQLLLSRHMQIHIPEEEREFLCDICNKLFPSNYLLNAHIRNVHQNVYAKICDQCGKSIRGREAFRTHLLEHAGVPIPTVQCELCGVNLKNKYSLNRHLKSVHNESSGPHVCNICGKVSPSSSALQNHKSYVHRSQRNHKCTLCAKAFKRPGELKEHMTTHTGEVLYTCPHCPKTFNSNANMHSHRKKMHRKEWEENRRHPHMGSATSPE